MKQEDFQDKIGRVAGDSKIDVGIKDFFESIDSLYRRPSLDEVVKEESSKIVASDPTFFEKYDIVLPKNQDFYLFDLYFDRHGKEGMGDVYYSAKLWFRCMRYFLVDSPDKEELDSSVEEYRNIIEGKYFDA